MGLCFGSALVGPPGSAVLRALEPQSPQAKAIFDMGMASAIIFAVIFLIVCGIVLWAFTSPRWRPGEKEPLQYAGNKRLEITWTIIPFLIVVGLWVGTAYTMRLSDPSPAPEPDIVVIGHQWWWEARYPKSGAIVANEIHIPVGKPISIRLDASDVLHEFWVPQLTRKMTTVPGHPNHVWLQADKPGSYLGFCSEYCGTEHAWMHFLVVATSSAEFENWQQGQLKPAVMPSGGPALKGAQLFQQMSCVNCHSINGTPANARFAPDLTHIASRREIGAGIAENNRENLRRWITNPQEVKPGAKMPDYKFKKEEVDQLADYLETLK